MSGSQYTYNVVFDYRDAPTLERFSNSEKRIRAVVGPFRSGKSSACCFELYTRATQQNPDSKGVRRTRWAVVRNCYDDKTEILTNHGWKLFKNVHPDDEVATLQNGKIVYVYPNRISATHYSGEMIGFESEGVNFLVTPDHEMWISKRHTRKKIWGEFKTVYAQDIYGSQTVRVRKDAVWESNDIWLPEEVFEWLGFWFAEGSYGDYGKQKRCVITQILPDGIEYAKGLFSRAGLSYGVGNRKNGGLNLVLKNNSHRSATIMNIVKLAGHAGEKTVPRFLMNAPAGHLRAFLKGFTMGDGHVRKEGTTTLYTSSQRLADDLQEIALKAGGAATIATRNRVGKVIQIGSAKGKVNYPEYIITLLSTKKYRPILHVNHKQTNHLRGWYKQKYDGIVYCAEMKIPTVFVRRSGKAFWCNRTYPELKDTTIKTFLDWFPPEYFGHFRLNPNPEYQMNFPLPDGTILQAEFLFRALDKPEHVKNLLSLEVTGAWFNEAREIPKIIIDTMDGRINQYPAMKDGGSTWGGMILDTNPCDTDHWWYKLFCEELPNNLALQEKYEYFHQPSGRSPQAENLSHLPKNYYQDFMVGKDADFISVYVDGQYGFVREGKVIYTNYLDSVHCAPELLKGRVGLPLITGWDFGLTPACVIMQYEPKGRLNVLHELCASEMGIRSLATNVVKPFILATYPGFPIISGCDPAGTHRSEIDENLTAIIELKNCGFSVKPAWTNALEARFSAIDNFLTRRIEGDKPAFQLSPECKVLRKGFNGEYKRRKLQVAGAEIYSDAPEKNMVSHPHEALQYAAMIIERGMRSYEKTGWNTQGAVKTNPPSKLAWA